MPKEGVADIPGAFLHAENGGTLHMLLDGEIEESINKNSRPMFYVQVK